MNNIHLPCRLLLILVLLTGFIGCSEKKQPQPVSKQDSLAAVATEQLVPADAPQWYLQASTSSATNAFTGIGMGLSRRASIARDKAILKAQSDLASKIQKLNTDTLITLSNTRMVYQKQIREGKFWRVYILLESKTDSTRKE